jgi:hypothetical protein
MGCRRKPVGCPQGNSPFTHRDWITGTLCRCIDDQTRSRLVAVRLANHFSDRIRVVVSINCSAF